MNKQVSILHGNYPSEVRSMVESRLDALPLFGNRLETLTARLDQSHEEHQIELVAGLGGQGTLVAKAERPSLGKALDEAIERLTAQLRRLHDRKVDRHKGH